MRKEKQLLLDEIKGQVEGSPSFILASYEKLSANVANDFRSVLEKAGSDFEVIRKRILMKAFEEMGIDVDMQALQGHIGVVLTKEDPLETAKVIYKFSKDNDNIFHVMGGSFDGKMYYADDVEKLSKLPSRDQMRSQLLGLLVAPMSQTLATMDALLAGVIYCLDNKVKEES